MALVICTVALLFSEIFSTFVGDVCTAPKVASSTWLFGNVIEEAGLRGTAVSDPVGSSKDTYN